MWPPRCLLLPLVGLRAAFAFAADTAAHLSSCKSTTDNIVVTDGLADSALRRIQSGRVYVHPNFLSDEQVNFLRRDMKRFEDDDKFVVNGLSDVRKGLKGEPTTQQQQSQGFDVKYDRSVCPIPWWRDTLSLSMKGEEVKGDNLSVVVSDDSDARLLSIQMKLQRLRHDLSRMLDRPTMIDNNMGHECYYSRSAQGSSLARHMDEKHEEIKGPRGWLLPSRRSLSWLVYLSEADDDDGAWDAQTNGGLLRTFPQKWYRSSFDDSTVACGSHNGNLQIGWLQNPTEKMTHPVFLDSWYDHTNPRGVSEPHCILYIVGKDNDDDALEIQHITAPWSVDATGGNVVDFLQTRAKIESATTSDDASPSLFLQPSHAKTFRLLEDRSAWSQGEMPEGSVVDDILPTRGTLVVFDSVSLPHEVTTVLKGRRTALAGWFHEATQPLGGNA